MRAIICGALIGLMASSAACAEDMESANWVMPGCREYLAHSSRTLFQNGWCAGIVHGVAGMTILMKLPSENQLFCADTPPHATNDQLVRVVVAYIEARPQRMHEPFTVLAFEAMQAAWPCRAKH